MCKYFNYLIIIFSCLFIAACGGESSAKKATLQVLKDPDSAKFGSFYEIDNQACLTVNARNSMGGYTGDHEVSLIKINGSWMVVRMDEISHESCVSVITKITEDKRELASNCKKIKESINDPRLIDSKQSWQKIYASLDCEH